MVEGRRNYVIKEKFNTLKGRLRKWNTVFFVKVNMEVEDNKAQINKIYALLAICKEEQVEGVVDKRIKATSYL